MSAMADNGDPEHGVSASAFAARRKELQTTFGTQANALLRKNLIFQKRNCGFNCCLIGFPVLLLLLLFVLQESLNRLVFSGDKFSCGCRTFPNGTKVCGIEYSDQDQIDRCALKSPLPSPPLLQVPLKEFRAELDGLAKGCRQDMVHGCPPAILYTGANKTLADAMSARLIPAAPPLKSSVVPDPYALLEGDEANPDGYVLGTGSYPYGTYYLESGLVADTPLYIMQPLAPAVARRPDWYKASNWTIRSGNFSTAVSQAFNDDLEWEYTPTVALWRSTSAAIHADQYNGFFKANIDKPIPEPLKISEVAGAYDYRDTSTSPLNVRFSVNVYYNRSFNNDSGADGPPPNYLRINEAMNLAVNAFLRELFAERGGPERHVPLQFLSEMPKPATSLNLDFASILGPLFYMWVLQLLYPVILYYLVYDKEKNLRTMMKMHGLGDGAYYLVQYLYFFLLSLLYVLLFMAFGSAINLKFFRINSYLIQFIFYFLNANNQIGLAFLTSSLFKTARLATIVGFIYVFGTGLLGQYLVRWFIEDPKFSSGALFLIELVPAFSLYRGLYEISSYTFIGNYDGSGGMKWANLKDKQNGIDTAMLILFVEWIIFLLAAYYFDQILDSGSGVARSPLFFLKSFGKKAPDSRRSSTADKTVDPVGDDVKQERETVESILAGRNGDKAEGYSIVCDNLAKVYPGRDGNPPKVAVRGMSLAVPRGECFGMLGPNGAGKTSSINMMIGFLSPSGGNALIEGMDIRTDMNSIYSIMGVCPQHDLLWEILTGREHLMFYGRLKNLKGQALEDAVEAGLKGVNLFSVKDKRSGKYSGGMKRRLSVAISLIGNPLVVYMDEPSTGLDPASRFNLWNVVKNAKRDRAIILTTHSMEEAEVLCDRLGIFVDGQFQCIGNPKELTARYGGSYVFTITTPVEQEPQAEQLAKSFSQNSKLVYSLSGTQKFEFPVEDVDISDVFSGVEAAKRRISIQAWGISNTTLEDVFINIAKGPSTSTRLT